MTDTAGRFDSREEQLELLQQRLALLGKAMLFLSAFLLVAQGLSNNLEDHRRGHGSDPQAGVNQNRAPGHAWEWHV